MKGMVGDSSFEHKQGQLLERLQKTVKPERLAQSSKEVA